MGSDQPDLQAQKQPAIHYIFFWTAGLSTLFVFNCFLSQLSWFKSRFDDRADFQISFFFTGGSFMAFLVFDKIMYILGFKRAILIIPGLLVVISTVIFLIGEHIEKSKSKYYSLVPLIVFAGFANSILQTSLIKYTFEFSYKEITAYNSGTALVGILANLIAIANAYFLQGEDNLALQALIYLAFQAIVLIIVMVIFLKYILVSYRKQVRSESESIASMDKQLVDTIVDVSPSQVDDNVLAPDTRLIDTLKMIAPFFFNMILVYTITLGIFPGFNIALGIGWTDGATFGVSIQIILLSFNIGDFFGKWMYGHLPLKDNLVPHIISLSRFAFVGFIFYMFAGAGHPEFANKAWLNLSFSFILAVTNGYVTSALFALSSERVPINHKSNSGFLMTLALLFGLAYGSLCAAFGSSDG